MFYNKVQPIHLCVYIAGSECYLCVEVECPSCGISYIILQWLLWLEVSVIALSTPYI